MKHVSILLCVAALSVFGCSKDKKVDGTSAAASKTPATPGTGSGKVLETMNSGGYTYAKVDVAGTETWVAGPEISLAVGAEVSFSGGSPMANFHSKTLGKTFEMIYFVSAIEVRGAKGTSPGAGMVNPHGGGMGDPHGGSMDPHGGAAAGGHTGAPAVAKADVGKIDKAKGGKTVAEVFQGKAQLSGQEVVVRGKVVKYTPGVMGRNWLHVQDGTEANGKNDLTVTTNDAATMGATVTVRGKVVTDKDFGAGYKYDVLVEDAKITAE